MEKDKKQELKKVKISTAKFIEQMKIKKRKDLGQKLIKISKINVKKNKITKDESLEKRLKIAIKKGEKEDNIKVENKEKELEEKVYKILKRTTKGIAKIGKIKYNKIVCKSQKDADKAKQVATLLIKRIYTVEILLREYIEEVDNR